MAALRIRLHRTPAEELRRLWSPRPPQWVVRTLETRGASVERPSASALVEALAEEVGRRLTLVSLLMRKAEARGWTVEVRGDNVVIATGLARDITQLALEADGVWFLVRSLTEAGDAELT